MCKMVAVKKHFNMSLEHVFREVLEHLYEHILEKYSFREGCVFSCLLPP